MLDTMEGREPPADGFFPEDWIGSTVPAVNPGREGMREGLGRVAYPGGEAVLSDLVASNPEYFLGAPHLSRFGLNPMVLVKYLDAAVRLPFQVHPTANFSRERMNATGGKTEAYYILGTRPEVAEPFIYLGFQRPPGRDELRRMILEQDIAAMEACFDRIPVRPGDVHVVPGGLPHAIGGGVLMVEVMEATDFVARVEFSVGGRTIPEASRFMGRDLEFALDMFSFASVPVGAARPAATLLEEDGNVRREALVDGRLARFNLVRTALVGKWKRAACGFTIFLVVEGECTMATPNDEISLRRFDRVLIPHGLESLSITAKEHAVFLECMPPRTDQI
jgi:mannose-6-phosphate isomerase